MCVRRSESRSALDHFLQGKVFFWEAQYPGPPLGAHVALLYMQAYTSKSSIIVQIILKGLCQIEPFWFLHSKSPPKKLKKSIWWLRKPEIKGTHQC